MKIYVSHSTSFNFKEELYKPLKESQLASLHEFIFPHAESGKLFNSKNLFKEKGCDLVLAEVSYPSTGEGIELGWAEANGIKIVCVSKLGAKVSSSLKAVSKGFLEYANVADLIKKLSDYLNL